jgi:4-hydroxybenzoate polyprenyltransferase
MIKKMNGGLMVRDVLISLRPRQWAKNIVFFAALIYSQNFFNPYLLSVTLAAVFVFCVASSSLYLINDCLDIDRDRKHPVKKLRPIAAGRLPVSTSILIAGVLMAWSVVMAFVLNRNFFYLLTVYLLIELAYSAYLKKVVILDILCIASGFLIRVLGGAAVIDVPISSWLLICTTFLSLFLALGKRRSEMVLLDDDAREHRQVLSEYSLSFIDQMITIVTASTIFSYVLYTLAPETVHKFNTQNLEYSAIFVIYGIFRYLYLIYQKKEGGAPERILFSDKPLLINFILFALVVIAVIYQ